MKNVDGIQEKGADEVIDKDAVETAGSNLILSADTGIAGIKLVAYSLTTRPAHFNASTRFEECLCPRISRVHIEAKH